MSARQWSALSLVCAIAIAGCVGSSPPANVSSSAPPTSAAAATADVSTGAISGRVIDDEVRPVPKASVIVAETKAETETDAEGKFTFNELQPGKFSVLVQKLGYESAGVKVEVRAGEVAEANIALKPVVIASEAYSSVQPKTALMHVGVTTLTSLQNESAVSSLACDPCRLPMHFAKNPDGIVAEGRWADGPTPVLNAGLNVWYYRDWAGNELGTNICYWQPSVSPYRYEWSENCVKGAGKIDKMLLHIQPGPIPGLLAAELKVETWTSFFYNMEIDEAYTALPPA
ncbi:MAG: carboxypeptidase regulatory-like domain-containing protein [Euryarchaeota archaeon]|nr:carboxypeptidase regulatory-like domain-containing protein [Euryarchaeota archaeon]